MTEMPKNQSRKEFYLNILKENSLDGCIIKKAIKIIMNKKYMWGNSLAVQWLGLCTSMAGGTDSVPGQGTKIPHATPCGQKKKKKEMWNRE